MTGYRFYTISWECDGIGMGDTERGLVTVEKYYRDYGYRARELKKQGKQVLGYLCAYVPLEIITAAGLVPFRIKGNVHEPITKANTQMETIVCPFIRSCYDMALKGKFDFIDGLVIPHSCDSVSGTYQIWKYTLNLPYFHFINVPRLTDPPSMEFFKTELTMFRKSLEKFTGRVISDGDLTKAIQLCNQNRAAIKALYDLRKSAPPLISGIEMTQVLVASMGIPVDESTELLSRVIDDVKQRPVVSAKPAPRIMVIGAQIDDTALIEIIESSGASVVVDDICTGTKTHWPEVNANGDPLGSLAERYLGKLMCPRTYRENRGTNQEERFGHIGRFIRDFKVDGVILYIYRYCDPYCFDVPPLKNYVEAMGVPVLYLEDEYSMSSMARLRTRVQAFLELMG